MRLFLLTMSYLSIALFTSVNAYSGSILDDESIANAEISALQAEAQLFEKLQNGVLLTVTQCEFTTKCDPEVSGDELQQIIDKLNFRISTLATRNLNNQEQDLEQILLSYAKIRDHYADMINVVNEIAPDLLSNNDEISDENFLTDISSPQVPPDLLEIFQDVDDVLLDDENLD